MRLYLFLDPIKNFGFNFISIFFMVFEGLFFGGLLFVVLHFFPLLGDGVVEVFSSLNLFFFVLEFFFLHGLEKFLVLFFGDVLIFGRVFFFLFGGLDAGGPLI